MLSALAGFQAVASGQGDAADSCVVSILNQTAHVQADGSWSIPNIPANMGPVRARVTCTQGGVTLTGTSDFFTITANRMNAIPQVVLGVAALQPVSIAVALSADTLMSDGETAQLTVIATLPDGSETDVTPASAGTVYQSTNPSAASVSPDGLVTALSSGRVLITILNEAILGTVRVSVVLSGDADGDGLPDDFELANGLNPNDPTDALEDRDQDGLTNLQEFNLGTDMDNADTDGDGISDGEEVVAGEDGFVTNPLLADTDGDGISDSLEIEVGTDPTLGSSFDFGLVLETISVEPSGFLLITNNVILAETSRRVTVTGRLIDGSIVDLTAGRGTSYSSSDLLVANFGDQEGRIFAGNAGTAVITASNAGITDTTAVQVQTFNPTALSFVNIPGYANGVAVNGTSAFVAAGTTGLQVVNYSNPNFPAIVASLDTPGNANDVRVVGTLAYIADGSSGLQIIDVGDPLNPFLLGSVDTPGVATDLAVLGNTVYVADGASGLQVIDVSNPTAPVLIGSVDTPGNARGVDVEGDFAVIADATSGVQIIDVSVPSSPILIGSTHTRGSSSRAADVAVRDMLAYVADGSNTSLGGVKVIDYRNPTTPFVAGATSNSFGLTGIAIDRDLALASDFFFVNAVPIFDIGTTTPTIRGNLNFASAPSFRDDNGTGIAVQDGLVFLTGSRGGIQDNGTSGNTGLHIGRYAILEDTAGVAPSVEITSPAPGVTVQERHEVTVDVTAEDDILVQAVDFLVDGTSVFTDFAAPYTHTFTVPQGATAVTLGATARDLAGNLGTAQNVVLVVIPDLAPTVRITSPADGSTATEGTTIPVTVNASDDTAVSSVQFMRDGVVLFADTTEPYIANIWVPVGGSQMTLTARATDAVANATLSDLVVVNIVPDQPPSVLLIEPVDGQQVIEGATICLIAGALDDVGVASVQFFVDGILEFEDTSEPFEFAHVVPLAITQFEAFAVATDTFGHQVTSATNTVEVIPDPGTTVVGTVLLEDGVTPAEGATVRVFELTTTTDVLGEFSLPDAPTVRGPIIARANLPTSEGNLIGDSGPAFPISSGITDVGTITLMSVVPVGVVVDRSNRSITVFDTITDTVVGTVFIPTSSNSIGDCSVTADGTLCFVTDFQFRVWVIDLTATPPALASGTNPIPISNQGEDVSITQDQKFLLVSDGGAAVPVSVIDIAARAEVSTLFTGSDTNSVDVCDDGSVLVTSVAGNVVRRLTVDGSGTLTNTGDVLSASGPNNTICAPGSMSGLVILRGARRIQSFTIPGLSLVDDRILTGSFGISGQVHPAGDRVYVRSNGGAIDVFGYDSATGALSATPLFFIPVASAPTFYGMDQMVLSADGTKLYVSQPGAVNVYDAATGALITTITDANIVSPTGLCVAGPM